MKKVARKLLGILFIVLGLLALITPFSPGSWLLLVGLEILGLRIVLERKILSFLSDKQKQKFKNLVKKIKPQHRKSA